VRAAALHGGGGEHGGGEHGGEGSTVSRGCVEAAGWCGGDAAAGWSGGDAAAAVVRRRCGGCGGPAAMRRLRWYGGGWGRCGSSVLVFFLDRSSVGIWAGPFWSTQEDDALSRGVIQRIITPWIEAPYDPGAGPASPRWLVNSVSTAPLTRALYFSTQRPCPGRYSKGLFCEVVTNEVHFMLKFVKRVIFVDFVVRGGSVDPLRFLPCSRTLPRRNAASSMIGETRGE
jgi:hypothetical protein